MRFSSAISTVFALSSLSVAIASGPTSPAPGHADITKRDLFCSLLGLCATSYLIDPNNCGTKGNVCKSSLSLLGLGSIGAVCINGVCGATCANLWDYNWLTGKCQDVSSDTSNCGACGTVCSLTGAATAKCSSGTCLATTCSSGYTLTAGACVKIINTQTDINNCGSLGKICPTSWLNGIGGSICSAGVCQAASCSPGFGYSTATTPGKCIDILSDKLNCGSCTNTCSFPNGNGACVSGVCTLSACASGFYNIAGVCVSLNLQTDSNNCGLLGKICNFAGGAGSCKTGTCTWSTCPSGFTLASNVCTAINTLTDIKNCGALGKVCAVPQFSSSAFCALGVCGANCQTGYDFNILTGACQPVTSDALNCGKCGNACTYANGYGTCVNSVCTLGSCKAGFYPVGGQCVTLNLQTDVLNCGAQNFACPLTFLHGSGVQCVAGQCKTTCLGLWDWNGSSCQDVSTDISNCGNCGTSCAVANGQGKCTNGVCSVASCYSGYLNINGACTYYNLQSDVNNCGTVGNKCVFNNGLGTCSAGVCTYSSCASPYVLAQNTCSRVDLTSDVNHCGSVTTACPASYLNGGKAVCTNSVCTTTCNTGFDFDFTYAYCRAVTTDVNNCGRCGAVCTLAGSTAATCESGTCRATACSSGYTLVSGVCNAINTQTDVKNCGSLGNACMFSPTTATGICSAGVCALTGCGSALYMLQNGVCVKNNAAASQRARLAKKDLGVDKRTLCPTGETACPIMGSASYDVAVSQHYSAMSDFSTVLAGSGGYECLDTSQSLESCGGCASTGEGHDCSKIRGAVGVGCDAGACVVFSCLSGWRPNLAGSRCVRAHVEHSGAANGTRSTSAPRRHLHARHSSHHHG